MSLPRTCRALAQHAIPTTPRGCRMVRSRAAAGAAITGNVLPRCCRQSNRSRRRRSRLRRHLPHSVHADARLRGDARGGGLRLELAARNERHKEGNHGGGLL